MHTASAAELAILVAYVFVTFLEIVIKVHLVGLRSQKCSAVSEVPLYLPVLCEMLPASTDTKFLGKEIACTSCDLLESLKLFSSNLG